MAGITLKPIGVIRTSFKNKANTPIQGACSPRARGRIEVDPMYADGLQDLEQFSHLYLLYVFHKAGPIRLIRPTFLDDRPHGIFASRHPCRPNGIGLSIVKLEKRKGRRLYISGIDVLDGTPLIDIKPYIPRFDTVRRASNGWVAGLSMRAKPEHRE